MDVWPVYMSVYHAHAWFPLGPEERVRFPTGATGSCELPCESWEWNPGHLNHQVISPALLSAGFWSFEILLPFCIGIYIYSLYSLPIAHFVLYICLKLLSCFIFIFSESHISYELEVFVCFWSVSRLSLRGTETLSWECSGLVTSSWVFLGNLVEFPAQPETQNMLYRLN